MVRADYIIIYTFILMFIVFAIVLIIVLYCNISFKRFNYKLNITKFTVPIPHIIMTNYTCV